jgi:Fur family ferric uptake transcriptional regulator
MQTEELRCCGDFHERANLDKWIEILQSTGLKLTAPRHVILEFLHKQSHPITNREIYNSISNDCDLASVYRSINLFIKIGFVQQFDFGDGIARFELIEPGLDSHHHHIICTDCSKVIEIGHCFSNSLTETIEKHTGFSRITHKLEFFGLCSECK